MFNIKNIYFLLSFAFIKSALIAQTVTLTTIADITNVLNESSGITYIAPNRLYTHNDSGGNDEIYELDTLGNLIRTIAINSANNSDWEDITQDDLGNMYIGDFGNNNNDRTNLRIYKIPSPSTFSGNSVTANLIEFNYPDQTQFPPFPAKRNFDVEGFVWYNDSLFLFSKNRTAPFNGYCKMYKIPDLPGTHAAILCDSIFICGDSQANCWVTSAAISTDKSHLALLGDNKIWWFSCYNDAKFFKGAMAIITLSSYTQKEGITFKNNHDVYITDELSIIDNSGGKLYKADLNNYLEMPYVSINLDTIICDNCNLSVDSFIGALSWSNGMFGPSITPEYTGWYTVSAKNLNNCIVTDSVYISYLQGLPNEKINGPFIAIIDASQNNISGILKNMNESNCVIQLTDLSGKIIFNKYIATAQNNQAFAMEVNISKGIYLMYVISNQYHKTYKIVIAK